MSTLKEREIVINVDEVSGDLASAMILKFQGPKAFDKEMNIRKDLQNFHDKLYNEIYRQLTGSASSRWNDISKLNDVEFPCVYAIHLDEIDRINPLDIREASDAEFIEEAIRQNRTYSLLRFQELCNDDDFDLGSIYIRIL